MGCDQSSEDQSSEMQLHHHHQQNHKKYRHHLSPHQQHHHQKPNDAHHHHHNHSPQHLAQSPTPEASRRSYGVGTHRKAPVPDFSPPPRSPRCCSVTPQQQHIQLPMVQGEVHGFSKAPNDLLEQLYSLIQQHERCAQEARRKDKEVHRWMERCAEPLLPARFLFGDDEEDDDGAYIDALEVDRSSPTTTCAQSHVDSISSHPNTTASDESAQSEGVLPLHQNNVIFEDRSSYSEQQLLLLVADMMCSITVFDPADHELAERDVIDDDDDCSDTISVCPPHRRQSTTAISNPTSARTMKPIGEFIAPRTNGPKLILNAHTSALESCTAVTKQRCMLDREIILFGWGTGRL